MAPMERPMLQHFGFDPSRSLIALEQECTIIAVIEMSQTKWLVAAVVPWARGYWVASSGNVTDEVWKQYIEDQKPEEPDDNFKVV
jgi:REP element-mobilizing transposase RayT